MDLRAIERHGAQLQHAHLARHQQHLNEQPLDLREKSPPKRRKGVVVGDAGSPSGSARRPNRKSHVPACGSKTPPWRSHTPRCPAEPQGGKRLSQSHDSSWSSRKGPDHRSPRPQTAPGVSSAATRPPTEVPEIRFHGRSGRNCSSIAHQSITCSALPRVYPTPPRRVKSDRLLGYASASTPDRAPLRKIAG